MMLIAGQHLCAEGPTCDAEEVLVGHLVSSGLIVVVVMRVVIYDSGSSRSPIVHALTSVQLDCLTQRVSQLHVANIRILHSCIPP